jgi:peptidylprolyl isomerase
MKLTRRLLLAAAAVAALGAAPVGAADDHLLYLDTKDGRVTIKLRPDLAPKRRAH